LKAWIDGCGRNETLAQVWLICGPFDPAQYSETFWPSINSSAPHGRVDESQFGTRDSVRRCAATVVIKESADAACTQARFFLALWRFLRIEPSKSRVPDTYQFGAISAFSAFHACRFFNKLCVFNKPA